jgi:translation initiation factor 5
MHITRPFFLADVTKYFGCELGAQTQFDFKNDRYIVNGSHDAAKLQDMLDGFIKKFVLCEQCDNPETEIKIFEKKGILRATCKACGHSFMLDMRHKLTTFIIKVSRNKLHGIGGNNVLNGIGITKLSDISCNPIFSWE